MLHRQEKRFQFSDVREWRFAVGLIASQQFIHHREITLPKHTYAEVDLLGVTAMVTTIAAFGKQAVDILSLEVC